MSSRFRIHSTPLQGVTLLERKPRTDNRGFFERVFCADDLREAGFHKPIAQINRSFTRQLGTVRGLHFQYPPHAETKVVSCLQGEMFDVAVDLRSGSPTFLCWHGEVLSRDNHRTLIIPEGFGHGFQTLSEDCEVLYLVTAAYAQQAEDGINPQDETLAIAWPAEISEISERDAKMPRITKDYKGLRL